jgi:hypothetical protein
MAGLRAAAVEAPPTLGDAAAARGLLLRAALLQGASAASDADGRGHHGASLLQSMPAAATIDAGGCYHRRQWLLPSTTSAATIDAGGCYH